MPYGAGVVASGQYWAAQRVDPRPHAVGSIRRTFEKYPHLHDLLPAMGYSETQRHELEETINRTPCDVVVLATPVGISGRDRTVHGFRRSLGACRPHQV